MLTGISLRAHPTEMQKLILSQWMGCSRFIWNAKCDEDKYLSTYAKRYLPIGIYPLANQTYSQYKDKEITSWLFDCPSQILRNSASNWYSTYQDFLKGRCGKPTRKKKENGGSIHLTRELFHFEKCSDGITRLFIGSKKNNIGYLSIKNHAFYKEPNSIRLKKYNGVYSVSFCYDDGFNESCLRNQQEHLDHFGQYTKNKLEEITVGIDRGIKIPCQAGLESYDFSKEQKNKKKAKEKYIRRCQKRLSKKKKGSNRRKQLRQKLAKSHQKITNIRKDFCHQVSHKIVTRDGIEIIVFEDLKTGNMTKKPQPKKSHHKHCWEKNGSRSKAGLNKAILDKGWFQLELFIKYKAFRANKAVFKVSAYQTSQECSNCECTHPDNRKTQELFHCENCGHTDNADFNAAKVIKKRAINFILDSGTELSKRGVLLDSGRGAISKTQGANANCARSKETSKKKGNALVA